MAAINTFTSSERPDLVNVFWRIRLLLFVGAVILLYSAQSTQAQTDSTKLLDPSLGVPQVVSRNQLLAPGKALRFVQRAHDDIMNGHFDSALKEINRALDIAPHYAVPKVMQGGIYMDNGNYDGAAKSFQEAIDDDPAFGAAYAGMGVALLYKKRFQAALPVLDRAEGLLPAAWFVHFAKAWTYMELGNTEAAFKQADLSERFAGTNREQKSGVSYLRAMVSIHMNDAGNAKGYLAEAVAQDPDSTYAALAKKWLDRLQTFLATAK
jgi:tetratricopeptide (TPR) repeat protein